MLAGTALAALLLNNTSEKQTLAASHRVCRLQHLAAAYRRAAAGAGHQVTWAWVASTAALILKNTMLLPKAAAEPLLTS